MLLGAACRSDRYLRASYRALVVRRVRFHVCMLLRPPSSRAWGLTCRVFVAQLVNFGIVMLVLWKWGYAPLMGVISAREKKISDGLASARER